MTPQEVKLWNWLREEIVPAGFHFRRQAPFGSYVVDFACLARRLVVEVDGAQHGHGRRREADQARDQALAKLGYPVLRFWKHEIDREKRVVLDTIYAALTETPPPRPLRGRPSPEGEGSAALEVGERRSGEGQALLPAGNRP